MLNGAYLHKKDISRIRIYGKPGYLLTLIYEDDYEYIIHDTYIVQQSNDGVIFSGNVFYKGDKDDVSFEELEEEEDIILRVLLTRCFLLPMQITKKVKLLTILTEETINENNLKQKIIFSII